MNTYYLKENKDTVFSHPEITSIYTLVYILSPFSVCVSFLYQKEIFRIHYFISFLDHDLYGSMLINFHLI